MNFGQRIKQLREQKGISQVGLAKLVGISQPAIAMIETGVSETSKHVFKIAEALNVNVETLMNGAEIIKRPTLQVRKVGYVGAGAEAHFYEGADDPNEMVDAPPGSTDKTVAVEVRGNSLGVIWDRALVYYNEIHEPPRPELIRKLCVVSLANGQVLVKQLLNGTAPGLYHLLSNNEGIMENATLIWAAPVLYVKPR